MDILIIEDDEVIQALVAAVAQKKGHTTTVCASAEAGQTAWKEKKHPLIILDLNLPGMDGTEFCKWLRKEEEGADTFVVVATANNKVETFHNVLTAGANDYISKPLQPQLLAIRLEVAVSQISQILKKKEFQNEITQNEKRFRLLSENSRDLICTHNPDGTITYISPSSQNILGFSPQEILGKSFDDLKLDPNVFPLNKNCGTDEENGKLESTQVWRINRKDKEEVWLETYTQTNRDEQNKVKEIYSYSRDVTEQKNEEHQIKILAVLGENADSEAFLLAIIQEMEEKMKARVCIHTFSSSPDKLSYCFHSNSAPEDEIKLHKTINKETPHDKALFQPKTAAGVFHHIDGIGETEALLTQPIPGTFGRPIGKITITSNHPLTESERTKAILSLCATKIGCVLEEHITKD